MLQGGRMAGLVKLRRSADDYRGWPVWAESCLWKAASSFVANGIYEGFSTASNTTSAPVWDPRNDR